MAAACFRAMSDTDIFWVVCGTAGGLVCALMRLSLMGISTGSGTLCQLVSYMEEKTWVSVSQMEKQNLPGKGSNSFAEATVPSRITCLQRFLFPVS